MVTAFICVFLNFVALNGPAYESLGYDYSWSMKDNGELAVIKSYIEDEAIVFDVGANIGEWSQFVLALHPKSAVTVFEPISRVFKKLKMNLNKYPVTFENLALSDKTGTAVYDYYVKNSKLSGLFHRPKVPHLCRIQRPVQIEVKTETMENYCRSNSIEQIDFLKIDTEGAELAILKGAESMLRCQQISKIQFEYGGCYLDAKTTLKEVYELLQDCGYHVYRIIPNGLVYIPHWDKKLENYKLCNYFASKTKLPVTKG